MTNTGAGYQQWREAVAVCEEDTLPAWSLAGTYRGGAIMAQAAAVKRARAWQAVFAGGNKGPEAAGLRRAAEEAQEEYQEAREQAWQASVAAYGLDAISAPCRACKEAPECRTEADCVHADTGSGPYPECVDCDTGGYMREPDQCAKCRHLREVR